jgi:hypothetical protein
MVDGIANLRNKVVDIDMDKVARLRRAIGANSTKYGGSMANVSDVVAVRPRGRGACRMNHSFELARMCGLRLARV